MVNIFGFLFNNRILENKKIKGGKMEEEWNEIEGLDEWEEEILRRIHLVRQN